MDQIIDIKLSRTLSENEKKLFLLLLANAEQNPVASEHSMPLERLYLHGNWSKQALINAMISVRHQNGFFFIIDSIRISNGQLFYGLGHEYLAKRADPVFAKFFVEVGLNF